MSSLVVGWSLITVGFAGGALLGAGFHRDGFFGGYGSWPRRLLRLGHVACVALGMLNLLLVATLPDAPPLARHALALGGVAMPLACFLVAFRPRWRGIFALPVALLLVAAIDALVAAVRPGAMA
jgi:hypothetical protein